MLVTRRHVCALGVQDNGGLYLFTYCHTFPMCLFFFINAPVFRRKTMLWIGSGNYLQKCSWLNSLGFTVNPDPDNGLARQLFVLAGYFQPNSCTVSLSASYHGRHSPFWHTDTSAVCLFVHLIACMHLCLQMNARCSFLFMYVFMSVLLLVNIEVIKRSNSLFLSLCKRKCHGERRDHEKPVSFCILTL